MFFMRLRRGTKPIFWFLALVFAASFVFLGVGSGSTGIGDLLQGNFNIFGSSGSSIGKAKKAVEKHPNDPTARRKLATAYEQKGQTDDAIRELTRYTQLRSKDRGALGELGALYLRKAQELTQRYQLVAASGSDANAAAVFAPPANTALGKALGSDPISSAVSTKTST